MEEEYFGQREQQVQRFQGGITFPTWKEGPCLLNGVNMTVGVLCTDFFHSVPVMSAQMTH